MQYKTHIFNKLIISFAVLLLGATLFLSAGVFRGDKQGLTYAAENMADGIIASAPDVKGGKAAFLCDFNTGTEIYSKQADDRLPIASMVKIMTSLLTFEAIERGELSLDEKVTVSETASSMGGSQVFLDAGSAHNVSELLKSVVVASANDSCVALAERISGSVGGFVGDMNDRAKELNMTNTHFANCTGLPAPDGFSSARDVSIMLRELLKHPKYYEYAGIWLEDYQHPCGRATTMTNTNKLIRFYNGCDGGKTGFTSEAKFCLAATANRNGMRVIAVIIGSDSSKQRFADVSNMFNYAFANYSNDVLVGKDEIIAEIKVSGGKLKTVCLNAERDISVFKSRGDECKYEVTYDLPSKIKAPIERGTVVGKAYLTRDGVVIDEIDILTNSKVDKANIFDLIRRIGGKW